MPDLVVIAFYAWSAALRFNVSLGSEYLLPQSELIVSASTGHTHDELIVSASTGHTHDRLIVSVSTGHTHMMS